MLGSTCVSGHVTETRMNEGGGEGEKPQSVEGLYPLSDLAPWAVVTAIMLLISFPPSHSLF